VQLTFTFYSVFGAGHWAKVSPSSRSVTVAKVAGRNIHIFIYQSISPKHVIKSSIKRFLICFLLLFPSIIYQFSLLIASAFQTAFKALSYSIINLYVLNAFKKNCAKRILASSRLSVRPSAWNNSVATGRIFVKFGILFSENSSKKNQRSLKSVNNTRYFTGRPIYVHLGSYLAEYFLE
jgi:hypothetical protein